MAIKDELDKTDKKLDKVEESLEELNQKSIAMEVLQICEDQNKSATESLTQANDNLLTANRRLFILLIIALIGIIGISAAFVYYVTNYTTETTEEIADTNDGGNACIGNNCYNGDINYGESKSKN